MTTEYFEKYGILDIYKEDGDENVPSILECCEKEPYPGKEKILEFLRTQGVAAAASTGVMKDRITGESIRMPKEGVCFKKTKEFSWRNDLPYHVEKYNLRLPKGFEDYVLNQYQ